MQRFIASINRRCTLDFDRAKPPQNDITRFDKPILSSEVEACPKRAEEARRERQIKLFALSPDFVEAREVWAAMG